MFARNAIHFVPENLYHDGLIKKKKKRVKFETLKIWIQMRGRGVGVKIKLTNGFPDPKKLQGRWFRKKRGINE